MIPQTKTEKAYVVRNMNITTLSVSCIYINKVYLNAATHTHTHIHRYRHTHAHKMYLYIHAYKRIRCYSQAHPHPRTYSCDIPAQTYFLSHKFIHLMQNVPEVRRPGPSLACMYFEAYQIQLLNTCAECGESRLSCVTFRVFFIFIPIIHVSQSSFEGPLPVVALSGKVLRLCTSRCA